MVATSTAIIAKPKNSETHHWDSVSCSSAFSCAQFANKVQKDADYSLGHDVKSCEVVHPQTPKYRRFLVLRVKSRDKTGNGIYNS